MGALVAEVEKNSIAQELEITAGDEILTIDEIAPKDPKSTLQELVQKKDNGTLPVYEYLGATGASHTPTFSVRVTAMGQSAVGEGTSKKVASVIAAKELLKILANQDNEN